MVFSFGRYTVDIDVERTRAFYDSTECLTPSQACTCKGCQNYDRAILTAPESVLSFLRTLGLDPCKPNEVYGNEDNGKYAYSGWYHIVGTLTDGAIGTLLDDSNCYRPDETFAFKCWFHSDPDKMGWKWKNFPEPILELCIETQLPMVINL